LTGTPGPAPKAGCWAAAIAAAAAVAAAFILVRVTGLGAGTCARTLMPRCDMVALCRASGLRTVRVMRRQRVSQGCKLSKPSSPKAPQVPYFRANAATCCSTMWPFTVSVKWLAKRCTRVFKRVQLEGREHVNRPREVSRSGSPLEAIRVRGCALQ